MKRREVCSEWNEDGGFEEFSRPVPWQKWESEGLDCDLASLFTEEEAQRLFGRLEAEVVYLTGAMVPTW